MIRIGLISDTHSYLDDAVFTHFDQCDEIWHAGDFGSMEVAERLAAVKPLRGVFGNIDDQEIRRHFPLHLRFQCEGLDTWITHIGGYPGRYAPAIRQEMKTRPPGLFICGHSHILKVMVDKANGCLHLNPGAAGRSGWHQVRTLLRFSISDGKVSSLEAIEMGTRA